MMSHLGSFQQVTFTLHGFVHQLGTSSSCIIQLPKGGTLMGGFYMVDSQKVSDYSVVELQDVLNTIYQQVGQWVETDKNSAAETSQEVHGSPDDVISTRNSQLLSYTFVNDDITPGRLEYDNKCNQGTANVLHCTESAIMVASECNNSKLNALVKSCEREKGLSHLGDRFALKPVTVSATQQRNWEPASTADVSMVSAGSSTSQDHQPVNYPELLVNISKIDFDHAGVSRASSSQRRENSSSLDISADVATAKSEKHNTYFKADVQPGSPMKKKVFNIKLKQKNNIWKCRYCEMHFVGIKAFEKHLSVLHLHNELMHSCKPCEKSFATKARWKKHILSCPKTKCAKSPCCGTVFLDEESFQQHKLTSCWISKAWKCSSCEKRFGEHFRLQAHLRKHETTNCECGTCEAKFQNVVDLSSHMKSSSHGGLVNVCPTCNKTFSKRSRLHAHMALHQSKMCFVCPVCGKQFRHSGTLAHHLWFHRKGKTKQCNICGAMFYDLGRLKLHEKIHKPLCCRYCNTVFPNHYRKSRHEIMMHKECKEEVYSAQQALKAFGQLQCAFCKKTVQYASHFWHNENCAKEHICQICNAYCDSASSLAAHSQGHQGPYRCAVCATEILCWDSMIGHIQQH